MKWSRRLRTVFKKDSNDLELDSEIQFYLDHLIDEKRAAGMTPDEARHAALREFGGVAQIQEECRSSRGLDWLDGLVQDIRYAARSVRRRPAFALTVALVMATGIGASTAVFSVVDRGLFRPSPYSEPGRLVSLGVRVKILEFDFLTASAYAKLKALDTPLSAVTSWSGMAPCDLTGEQMARMNCARVESTFLPVLGIQPALGRNFAVDEDVPGAPPVALISYAVWKSRFGGDTAMAGRKVELDGAPVRVVGVLPEDFEMPALEKADLLIPQYLPRNPAGQRPLHVLGRMKPGATPAQVRDRVAAMVAQHIFAEAPPQYRNEAEFIVRGLRELQTGDLRLAYWTLLAAVLAMLLIACANTANLMLARAVNRQREMAVRAAMGAARTRLMRQLLTESLLLSLAGGAGGCLLAGILLRLFVVIAPAGIPRLAEASLDWRVLLFVLCASLTCGVLFGLGPALQTPKPSALTGGRVAGAANPRLRHLLVGAQLAVSLTLLTCAGLLLQSLWNQQTLPLGLRPEHVVVADIALGPRYGQPAARLQFFEQLEERLRAIPGVDSVAVTDTLPPGGIPRSQPYFALRPEGRAEFKQGTGGLVVWRLVTPEYFRALGIPILRGRGFTEQDRSEKPGAIIVSQALAAKLFPDRNPVQARFQRGPNGQMHTVVGVAGNVRNGGLGEHSDMEYYLVRRHAPEDGLLASSVILRSSGQSPALAAVLRATVAGMDRALPVKIQTFEDHIGELAARPRFQAALLTLFALLGLLMAATGLYGLISFLVAQREQEFGIRLALGASPAQIARMMLAHAARWTAGGLLAGVAGSAIAAHSLRGLLFRVPALDPKAFTTAALLLAGLALLAALPPARRASRLDPMATLRRD